MYALIIIIHTIACGILITMILLQSGRGGGLSDLFGTGPAQTIFGTRASTFLTRATTLAAVVFLLTCISLTVLSSRQGKSLLERKRIVTEQPQTESSLPPVSQEIQEEKTEESQTPPEEAEEPQD